MQHAPPKSATLANIRADAARLIQIESEIESLAAELTKLKSEKDHIAQIELPRMMAELELDLVGAGNRRVAIEVMIVGDLPKDPERRLKALNWLNDNGHGGAIKRILRVDLPRDNDAVVQQAVDMLEHLSLMPTLDHSMHHQTYRALAREIVRSGAPAPLDDLGIYISRIAKVQ